MHTYCSAYVHVVFSTLSTCCSDRLRGRASCEDLFPRPSRRPSRGQLCSTRLRAWDLGRCRGTRKWCTRNGPRRGPRSWPHHPIGDRHHVPVFRTGEHSCKHLPWFSSWLLAAIWDPFRVRLGCVAFRGCEVLRACRICLGLAPPATFYDTFGVARHVQTPGAAARRSDAEVALSPREHRRQVKGSERACALPGPVAAHVQSTQRRKCPDKSPRSIAISLREHAHQVKESSEMRTGAKPRLELPRKHARPSPSPPGRGQDSSINNTRSFLG